MPVIKIRVSNEKAIEHQLLNCKSTTLGYIARHGNPLRRKVARRLLGKPMSQRRRNFIL